MNNPTKQQTEVAITAKADHRQGDQRCGGGYRILPKRLDGNTDGRSS